LPRSQRRVRWSRSPGSARFLLALQGLVLALPPTWLAGRVDLAQQQFQSGNINILLLLTQEIAYQQAAIALVQAQAARLSDTAALYQALGGGWWNRVEPLVEKKFDLSKGEPVPIDFKIGCGSGMLPC